MIRTYRELRQFNTFEERYRYLSIGGVVGRSTFGFDRWINQQFYTSRDWRRTRQDVIARDLGCDLGIEGYEIYSDILVHHINPITAEDITRGVRSLLNPDQLITTTKRTHNAIHYGAEDLPPREFVERRAGDTKLW